MLGKRTSACALGALLLTSLTGCSSQPGTAECPPAPLTVSRPSDLVRLQNVTVSSKGFTCRPSDQHGLETIVGLNGSPLARVPVQPDGSFSATFQVPADAPLGPSEIAAFGPTMNHCQGGGQTCARYAVGVTVRRQG
jgi:hypothetical protein